MAIFELSEGIEATFQKVGILFGVGGVAYGARQQLAVGREQDVVGLRVGVEVFGLEVRPFVAYAAQLARAARDLLDDDLFFLGQLDFFVHVERDEYVLVAQEAVHFGLGPYVFLHLAAVDTSMAREVDHHGFAFFSGVSQPRFQVVEAVQVVGALLGMQPAIAGRWRQTTQQLE